MPTITVTEQATRELNFVPCLKCGGVEVSFFDHGYTQGNSGGGKCKTCGNECSGPLHWDAKTEHQVAIWNAQNDPEKLIAVQRQIIQTAETRIQEIEAQRAALAMVMRSTCM